MLPLSFKETSHEFLKLVAELIKGKMERCTSISDMKCTKFEH